LITSFLLAARKQFEYMLMLLSILLQVPFSNALKHFIRPKPVWEKMREQKAY